MSVLSQMTRPRVLAPVRFALRTNSTASSRAQQLRDQASSMAKNAPAQGAALLKQAGAVAGRLGIVRKLQEPVTYWTKFTGELLRKVYRSEKLAPPSLADIESTYRGAWSFVKSKPVSEMVSLFQKDAAYYSLRAVELLGIFSLGEMIGRRHLVGYAV